MKKLDVIAVILAVVSALNWGLVAVAHFDLVAAIFGMKLGKFQCSAELCTGLSSGKPLPSREFQSHSTSVAG